MSSAAIAGIDRASPFARWIVSGTVFFAATIAALWIWMAQQPPPGWGQPPPMYPPQGPPPPPPQQPPPQTPPPPVQSSGGGGLCSGSACFDGMCDACAAEACSEALCCGCELLASCSVPSARVIVSSLFFLMMPVWLMALFRRRALREESSGCPP